MLDMHAELSTFRHHLTRWIYHSAIATAGSLALGFVLEMLLSILKFGLMMRLKILDIVDTMLFKMPYAPAFLGAGFLLGYLLSRRRLDKEATFVWILPCGLLVWNVATWNRYPGQGNWWRDMWDNYFGPQCGSSECLYELFVTVPFLTSLTYALGSRISWWRGQQR